MLWRPAQLAHERTDSGTTVLTAGTPSPDTVAAIVAPALPKLLAAWCREYDWLVLDSPPAFIAERRRDGWRRSTA